MIAARQGKEPSEAKKPGLMFKVNPATDSDCIWEGEVVGDSKVDGEYSVEDPLEDTIPYDLNVILNSRQPSIDLPVESGVLHTGTNHPACHSWVPPTRRHGLLNCSP